MIDIEERQIVRIPFYSGCPVCEQLEIIYMYSILCGHATCVSCFIDHQKTESMICPICNKECNELKKYEGSGSICDKIKQLKENKLNNKQDELNQKE
jgi:hypothetical protein